ncbi:hypothetical protein VTN77DRAFT_9924 [Rasamsonia byssochlamydoides]|uniref:uncharacterized protein n=1 Tax=Rasamsonia byssochlamydoides TaxID=89139 RepID=UPI003743E04F
MRINPLSAAVYVAVGLLPVQILAGDVLRTDGFTICSQNSTVQVQTFDIEYVRSTQVLTFNVAGTSDEQQYVTASLTVTAYGKEVYQKDFDPCAADSRVDQLCPVPAGSFAASGSQTIPDEYASMIPSIAFTIPDLEGKAKLELKTQGAGADAACIVSDVTNGRTLQAPAVSYAAVGIAGAALALSGLSAAGFVPHPGAASSASPGFGDVMGWFHTLATSGMLSVEYPSVYRSFTTNFGFSTGLIPWGQLQISIDNFRNKTGGNLTDDSYQFLQNVTLVYDGGSSSNSSSLRKRALDFILDRTHLLSRDISTSVNGTGSVSAAGNSSSGGIEHMVHGIQAYAEQLSIPQANTFMTVLLIFAIVIAAIAVGILLFKVILEAWALYGSFPASLTDFRKHYWGLLGRTITNLVLIIYGTWTLYCIYQFTRGDSWAAKLLAAVTLALFTGVLVYFTVRISQLARRYKNAQGGADILFEDMEVWRKYSLFYDAYKRDYWWLFVPAIVYMFVKGCIIAAGDGHGLVQTGGQLIVETLMLILLLWSRPYVAKSSQWINITIQVVRVLSVACILVFVQELGISQTTKTVTGIVLIALQSTLTGLLAVLIAVNALITCIRQNPHLKRRQEKMNQDFDNLTPLDARNSLLMDPRSRSDMQEMSKYNMTGPFEPYRDQVLPKKGHESTDRLIPDDYDYHHHQHTRSMSRGRSPSPDDYSQPPQYGVAY